MIDDRRYLVAWTDFHELGRHLRLFPKIDRNDFVRQSGFFKHHARLVAVIRRPCVTIDHLSNSLRLTPICRQQSPTLAVGTSTRPHWRIVSDGTIAVSGNVGNRRRKHGGSLSWQRSWEMRSGN